MPSIASRIHYCLEVKMSKSKLSLILPMMAAVFGLQACTVFPDAPPATLYALELPQASSSTACAVRFALREVRLPGYMDRAEVVLSNQDNVVKVSALQLWAAPLSKEMARLFAVGLNERLSGSRLLPYPLRQLEQPDLLLTLELVSFSNANDRVNVQYTLAANELNQSSTAKLPKINTSMKFNYSSQTGVNSKSRSDGATMARQLGDSLTKAIDYFADELTRQVCR
jgi:uncharacterized lipoprotein YmbA